MAKTKPDAKRGARKVSARDIEAQDIIRNNARGRSHRHRPLNNPAS
jgi:hypothetical protein